MNRTYANAELIQKARSGDQSAITDLYQQTYDQAYHTVRSMIRDEDEVLDILQDSYMKVFTHLDSFEGDKFTAWVREIAANTARDALKKKRPLLFSELEQGNESDIPVEERFEDDNAEHLPEYVIDRDETSRLIREILDELPEDQRAAIGMYYYEEMSVKEIAAAMDATENAVKSRLLYGRRKIEKKVRELEKKGTKLYSLSPILFLLWLLRSREAQAAEKPNAAVLQNVLEELSSPARTSGAAGTAAAGTARAAGTAKAAAAAGTGLSRAKLAIAVIAAAAVLGGAIFGITKITKQSGPAAPVTSPSAAAATKESAFPVPESTAAAAETTAAESTSEETTAAPETEPSAETTEEETELTSTADPSAEWIANELAAGRTVLTGTVESIGYDQAVKLQGYPDYNAADKGQTWIIIQLDQPQILKGSQDVSTWEKEYSVVLIWTRRSSGSEYGENIMNGYSGKHIICSAGSFSRASDTSVPIGIPWAHDIRICETNE